MKGAIYIKASLYIWMHFPHFFTDLDEISDLRSSWPGVKAQGVRFGLSGQIWPKFGQIWPDLANPQFSS